MLLGDSLAFQACGIMVDSGSLSGRGPGALQGPELESSRLELVRFENLGDIKV